MYRTLQKIFWFSYRGSHLKYSFDINPKICRWRHVTYSKWQMGHNEQLSTPPPSPLTFHHCSTHPFPYHRSHTLISPIGIVWNQILLRHAVFVKQMSMVYTRQEHCKTTFFVNCVWWRQIDKVCSQVQLLWWQDIDRVELNSDNDVDIDD